MLLGSHPWLGLPKAADALQALWAPQPFNSTQSSRPPLEFPRWKFTSKALSGSPSSIRPVSGPHTPDPQQFCGLRP